MQSSRNDDRRPMHAFSQKRKRGPEVCIYGIHAARACASHRPEKVLRAFFSEQVVALFGPLMKELASLKRPYRVVPAEELDRISGSRHHEGVCLIVEPPERLDLAAFMKRETALPVSCPIALEGVGNPHNIGAVMRVAAQFGSSGMIVEQGAGQDSGAAARVAQGGAEWVQTVPVKTMADALRRFKEAGFLICATSSHQGENIYEAELPAHCLFLLGDESRGLSRNVIQQADQCLTIPGTGHVESLNVACAASIMLGQFWNLHAGLLAPEDDDLPDPFEAG